jgi:hypothetical protein
MTTLHEMADQMELRQLTVTYANAIDMQNWDELDQVFTPDAFIDYTCFGGPKGRYPEIKQFLKDSLTNFPFYMHFTGNVAITVKGDEATGRIACLNPMGCALPEGGHQIMWCTLWYLDKYVRTKNGWRMSERVEQRCYVDNVPEYMKAQMPK